MTAPHQHQPGDAIGDQRADLLEFALLLVVRTRQQQRITRFADTLLKREHAECKVLVLKRRDHRADNLRALGGERARGGMGYIAEILRDLAYPVLQCRSDRAVAVQDARYARHGYAGSRHYVKR